MELCDSATILRGGRVTGNVDPRQESASSLARMMIGKELPVVEHGEADAAGEDRLVVAGLTRRADDPFGTDLEDIHLAVRSGEIVGIAGVSGNGQRAPRRRGRNRPHRCRSKCRPSRHGCAGRLAPGSRSTPRRRALAPPARPPAPAPPP